MKQIKKAIDWFIADVLGYEDYDPELEMMEEDIYMGWMDMTESKDNKPVFNNSNLPSESN